MNETLYRTVVADPPWRYRDRLTMSDVKRASGSHYSTMSVEEICGMGKPLARTVAGYQTPPDAFLWLWITNPFLLDGTGAHVCRAWGYEPRQLVTWVKGRVDGSKFLPQIGMGHFTRGTTEHLILATRGTVKRLVLARNVPNVLIAPRSQHSRKPDEAYALIERVSPGPYLELFARRPRENWAVWGNEVAA